MPLIIKGEWEVDGRTMEALDEGAELWFANKQMEQGNVCVCARVCVRCFLVIYINMYTFIHTYIHAYIHIHTHTYIYTCTCCGFRNPNKQMQQGIGVLEPYTLKPKPYP